MLERLKKTFHHTLSYLFPVVVAGTALPACNPFSPGLDDVLADQSKLMGDRRTVDGFFEWFRNSYQLRDSTLYGQILAPNFRFTFFDFSNNTEVSWDRGTEIHTTYKMFRSVRSTSLQWNQYIQID
ncbi:MAG: hypothetical protein LPK19_15740, partial [Hymenobacteraceae bacterium]|nr:hypothetical protein [Hymenobacteraceae bacterium]MDX5397689.1 hypothetical protein [Hymenobacteraceae bacterium]MDX5513767.1 hypothetical protein [Hymenobacteraceae bacterium]